MIHTYIGIGRVIESSFIDGCILNPVSAIAVAIIFAA